MSHKMHDYFDEVWDGLEWCCDCRMTVLVLSKKVLHDGSWTIERSCTRCNSLDLMKQQPCIGMTRPGARWMTWDTCKVCNQLRWVDCCHYCGDCYPYGNSTDVYKQHVEQQLDTLIKCDHNYYGGTCSSCGQKQPPKHSA